MAAGIFNVGVSLESLDPAINEVIRPHKNGTAKTLRCIELLLKERELQKRHISLNIKTVLTDINLQSFPDLVRRFGKIEGVMCTPQLFELMDDMPEATKELLTIKNPDRLQAMADEILELKRQGYTVHISEQGLRDMVKQCTDRDPTATMHNKKLEMDPSEPECNIGTDNLWIDQGLVKLCPYHPPIGNFAADTHTTLKEMWYSEMTRQIRAGTRACRRICTISHAAPARRSPIKCRPF